MIALSLALLIPWAVGVVLLLADGRRRLVGWVAVAAMVGNMIALVVLAVGVLPDGSERIVTGGWTGGVGIVLDADPLGVTFALLSSFVVLAALVHEVLEGVRSRIFPALVLMLTTGLTGLFLTGDIFSFYVFFELAMIAAYVLTTYGDGLRQLGSALIFAVVNLLGSFLFLIAVAATYHVTGTLAMDDIAARMATVEPNAAILIAVTFFVAFGTKLGLFPFHFWLPTVYVGTQPAIAAILAGALANIGAYGLLRFGAGLLPEELAFGSTVLIVIGCMSVIYGALLAISRRDPSEMLAYSAIGQAGYVLIALGVGGPIGLAAAVLYAVLNALSKALLFLSGGLRGALVAAAFAVGALSLAGIPPAAGFLGKLELFRTAVDEGSLALVVLLFAGGALAFVYVFQLYQHEFWRQPDEDEDAPAASRPGVRVVSVVLALVVLALGIWPEPLLSLSSDAAAALAGSSR